MKDLSFILPILDRHWFGLTVKPSLTGEQITRVLHVKPILPTDQVWWQVFLGHVAWGAMPWHPADRWLLDVAARHSS